MSIISSKSSQSKKGFTPFHSQIDFNAKQLSLFSRLNLNDYNQLDKSVKNEMYSGSSDLFSLGSKKRKMSQQLMKSSKRGHNTFLNRSFTQRSSSDELVMELGELLSHEEGNPKKEDLSENNSCPVILTNQPNPLEEERIQDKRRFTKTKNLLRNMSSYAHKFMKYNARAEEIIKQYFRKKHMVHRKSSSVNSMEEEGVIIEEQYQAKQNQQIEIAVTIQYNSFLQWIEQLSLCNFNDYQQVWTTPHPYRSLYRMLCYKYYRDEAYCDIYRSRLTTKAISVQFLPQFIHGILQPSDFYRFQ